MNRITNIKADGNGGHGIVFGPGAKAEVTNLRSTNNGGAGVMVHSEADVSGDDWYAANNEQDGFVFSYDEVEGLRHAWQELTPGQQDEVVAAAKDATSKGNDTGFIAALRRFADSPFTKFALGIASGGSGALNIATYILKVTGHG